MLELQNLLSLIVSLGTILKDSVYSKFPDRDGN